MKKALLAASALAVMTAASSASAAVYTYNVPTISNWISGGATITIDTTAQTATFSGPNINLVMTDSQLATFDPATNAGTYYTVDNMTGTFTRLGVTYDALYSTTPKHTSFCLACSGGNGFLWMYGDKDGDGNWDLDYDGKLYGVTHTSSTGGSGTPVPAPGALALMGLGLAAVTFGRRRRKVAA